MNRALALALAVLLALAAACGSGAPAPTPTPSQPASAGPTPTPAPAPLSEKLEIAGLALYPADDWYEEGRSACASMSLEAPYLGPAVFSIRDEQLPQLQFTGHETPGVRVCKHAGVTSLAYIFGDGIVELIAGPPEWPVRAARDQISAGEISGHPAVFVEPRGEPHFRDAQVLEATDFGLIFAALDTTLGDAKAVASAIDPSAIAMPLGKPSFEGTLNGIRFYNELTGDNRADGCKWGSYGLQDPRAVPVANPDGSPLDVMPSYVPEGYALGHKEATDCGGGVDLVEVSLGSDISVLRLAGEASWHTYYSEDWLTAGGVAGLPAVFIKPPWQNSADTGTQVVVRESFGLTVVLAPSLDAGTRVAEGLNR